MKTKLTGLMIVVSAIIFSNDAHAQYDNNYFIDNSVVLNNPTSYSCGNVNFESGNFSHWFAYYGASVGLTNSSDGIAAHSNAASLPAVVGGLPHSMGIINDYYFDWVTDGGYIDPYVDKVIEGTHSLRLGAVSTSNPKGGIKQRIKVDQSNAIFEFSYAVVALYNSFHPYNDQGYFRFYLEDENYNIYPCSELRQVAGSMTSSTNVGTYDGNAIQVQDWQTHTVNLLDFVDINEEITIVFEVATCAGNSHFAYAYIDGGTCSSSSIVTPSGSSTFCMEGSANFSHPLTSTVPADSYLWAFYDNDEGTGTPVLSNSASPSMTYDSPGDYLVTFNVANFEGECPNSVYSQIVTIIQCCDTCVSFEPNAGDYWFSAWVSVEYLNQQKTYNQGNDGAYASLTFTGGGPPVTAIFYPVGEIIDGWQRMAGKFTIPSGTAELAVNLFAHNNYDSYFDDIRIHPFNASMKSYVYDGKTFWLVAELDDNNYATFYEYDEEGGLVRIKKETARGIVTIQETRSNTVKVE